ncbi:MAG: DNA topoisomerase, partial [Pirellulaceae bacterium]
MLAEDTADTTNSGRWSTVREEINHLLSTYGKTPEGKRRTSLESVGEEPEYSVEDFIIAENCVVVVTADGWVKRQKQILDLSKSRTREGDRILA